MSTRSTTKRNNKEKRRPQSKEIIDGKVKNTDIRVNKDTHKRRDAKTKTATLPIYEPIDSFDPRDWNRLYWDWGMNTHIFSEDEIIDIAFNGKYPNAYKKVKENFKQFIDDCFFRSSGCLAVTYVARKYGFEEYTNGKPAKSLLNVIIKNIFLLSGGRADHLLTRHLQETGAFKLPTTLNHTQNETHADRVNNAYIFQKELLKKVPTSDPIRTIFEPSPLCIRIILDIDGLKSKYETVGRTGKKTYKWQELKDAIAEMAYYEAYKNETKQILEVATNYPKTMVNQ